ASCEPFCVDTLAFEEWLQWIFLPRMKVILENDEALPAASGILVMAELIYRDRQPSARGLLESLGAFDRLICGGEGSPPRKSSLLAVLADLLLGFGDTRLTFFLGDPSHFTVFLDAHARIVFQLGEVGAQRFAVALTLGLLVRDLLFDLAIDLALLGVACCRLFGRVRWDGRLRWGHDRVQGFGRLTGRGLRAEMGNGLSIHPFVNLAGHDAAAQGEQQAAGYNQRSHAYPFCLWMRTRAVLY